MKEKKILIISANAFSKCANNGKTLESMFSSFRKEQLAQLFTRPLISGLNDFNYASSYYKITESDIINRLLLKTSSCGGVLKTNVDNSNYETSYTQGANMVKKYNFKIWNILRNCLWKTKLWQTRSLKQWIDTVDPDIIFAVLGRQNFLYDITKFICNYKKIPFAVFYTDDYILHSKLSVINKKWMLKNYNWAISNASCCFCIGELMSKEYSTNFNRVFYPIMNSIVIPSYYKKDNNLSSNVEMSYFGSLSLNRWSMILRIGKILGNKVRINIYTSSIITKHMMDAIDNSNIIIQGFVGEKDIQMKMRESDILLHVESDDEHTKLITSLSVSTKIPEYLSSGRMVVGYGPNDIASMRLLEDNKIGLVLKSTDNVDTIMSKIEPYLDNPQLRDDYGRRGYEYAIKTFNNEVIASNFKTLLYSNSQLS